MAVIGEIFISHTHADAEIAHALSDAIAGIFKDLLTTSYSTKKELEGGIKPGEEWFRWIVDHVRSADIAVILMTPSSTQKPWVLWEAGAVYGAGLASAEGNPRKVRPLLFKLSGSQVPSPFAGIQGVNGDERSDIEKFMLDLLETFAPQMTAGQSMEAGRKLTPTIDHYLDRVEKALRDAPLLPTEAAVQEWCERLDNVTPERPSEVGYLHDWLNLTFGRGRDERPLPIDLRLHRRLAFAYAAAKRPDRAIQEFSLALEFAPRDIFLLRSLGKAYLDAKRSDEAAKTVDRIADLDAEAFSYNVECAALKGRLQRERNDAEGAAETYRRALERNPDSYYLADLLGQIQLRLHKLEEARSAYRRAGEIIDGLAETNIWTHATRATAAIVVGDELRAMQHLAAIPAQRPPPTPADLQTIEAGLDQVRVALNLDAAAMERWRAALRRIE